MTDTIALILTAVSTLLSILSLYKGKDSKPAHTKDVQRDSLTLALFLAITGLIIIAVIAVCRL